jgi:hypothetical protein
MTPFRMLALVLVAVLLVTAATPARAEAMDPSTMIAIASTGVGIIILVAFLIVANVSDRKQAGAPAPGLPIGGTPVESAAGDVAPVAGVPTGETPVAGTTYVATPAPAAPRVVAPSVEGL